MKLSEYRRRLSAAKRQSLQQRLDLLSKHSGSAYQFVINLDDEARFDSEVWRRVVETILQSDENAVAIKAALTQVFRNHTLRGGSIPPPWPTRYGRAVTKERFYQQIIRRKGGTTQRQLDRFVSSLIHKSPTVLQKRLGEKLLAEYSMWATFCAENPASDPFTGFPSDANSIRACLGLDHNEQGDLLLLVYSLPAGIEPLFPTLADAYSGNAWFWFFRPSQPHEPYGRTLSWPWRDDVSPCPEIVHARIMGATLKEINIAKE